MLLLLLLLLLLLISLFKGIARAVPSVTTEAEAAPVVLLKSLEVLRETPGDCLPVAVKELRTSFRALEDLCAFGEAVEESVGKGMKSSPSACTPTRASRYSRHSEYSTAGAGTSTTSGSEDVGREGGKGGGTLGGLGGGTVGGEGTAS